MADDSVGPDHSADLRRLPRGGTHRRQVAGRAAVAEAFRSGGQTQGHSRREANKVDQGDGRLCPKLDAQAPAKRVLKSLDFLYRSDKALQKPILVAIRWRVVFKVLEKRPRGVGVFYGEAFRRMVRSAC